MGLICQAMGHEAAACGSPYKYLELGLVAAHTTRKKKRKHVQVRHGWRPCASRKTQPRHQRTKSPVTRRPNKLPQVKAPHTCHRTIDQTQRTSNPT